MSDKIYNDASTSLFITHSYSRPVEEAIVTAWKPRVIQFIYVTSALYLLFWWWHKDRHTTDNDWQVYGSVIRATNYVWTSDFFRSFLANIWPTITLFIHNVWPFYKLVVHQGTTKLYWLKLGRTYLKSCFDFFKQ